MANRYSSGSGGREPRREGHGEERDRNWSRPERRGGRQARSDYEAQEQYWEPRDDRGALGQNYQDRGREQGHRQFEGESRHEDFGRHEGDTFGRDRYSQGGGYGGSGYMHYDYNKPARPDEGRREQTARDRYRGSQDQDANWMTERMSQSRQDDYDPDYRHWREEQLRNLDEEYEAWCQERRKKFSSEYDSWRKNRAGGAGSNAANLGSGGATDEQPKSSVDAVPNRSPSNERDPGRSGSGSQ